MPWDGSYSPALVKQARKFMSDILVDFYHDARGGIGFQYGLAIMAVAVAVVEAVRLMGLDVGGAVDTLAATLR
jgi:hypothetical protein